MGTEVINDIEEMRARDKIPTKAGRPLGLDKLKPDDLMAAKDFMLLQRIIKRVNSILDKKELLKQIVEDISTTLGFTRCAILLYHENTDKMEIAALTGWDDDNFYPGFMIDRDYGIVWKAVREQRIIYIPDVLDFPDEIPCAFTSRSHLDIPLYHHKKFIGILNAQNIQINAFSKHDLRLLRILASHITIAIENARLFEVEKKEKESMQSELKEAKYIQSALFPKEALVMPGFEIDGLCEPCLEVGGDWYDYIKLPSGKIGVVLADVSGKGLPAAFLMSSARTIFRVIAASEDSPSKVLTKVNDYLIGDLPSTRFITMIYLVLDPATGNITMANAGHMWPMHKSLNSVRQLDYESSFPLGIKKEDYKEYEIKIESGDKLILYSDGVSEAANGQEIFFDERMIIDSLQKDAAGMCTIYADLKLFVDTAEQNDDITLVEITKK